MSDPSEIHYFWRIWNVPIDIFKEFEQHSCSNSTPISLFYESLWLTTRTSASLPTFLVSSYLCWSLLTIMWWQIQNMKAIESCYFRISFSNNSHVSCLFQISFGNNSYGLLPLASLYDKYWVLMWQNIYYWALSLYRTVSGPYKCWQNLLISALLQIE